jgi:trimethylamine--corrinoid protein Co-methyltransferase
MSDATQETGSRPRRAGGRAARIALREAGPKNPAVGPGMTGGAYRPLSDHELERIHHAALDVLENIGMDGLFEPFRTLALEKGCRLNDQGRLCFPRALVDDIVAGAGRNFVLHGRDPAHDLEIGGTRVHYGTAGMAVTVHDGATNTYRASTIADLYDFARLADQLDNIHFFGRTVVATEITDLTEFDMSVSYACAAGTKKHFFSGFNLAQNVARGIAMFDTILGAEGDFRKRPFATANTCSIVPPLRFGEDNGAVSMEAARLGMPVNMVVAAQAGATAPAALAGTLVQTVAETLAGLALTNFVTPGHPTIFSNWPFVSDLRTGAFSGGGGEEALLNAASAQIANFLDLPAGVAAGMADSKMPDNQAGYEKGMTTTLAGIAGANLVFESAGMLASLLGCSFEAMAIDNDMLGGAQRAVRGIEVTDDTLSYEVIDQAVNGVGHYLGSAQTLSLMESEYVYPHVGDRSSPGAWQGMGSLDAVQRARFRVDELLCGHYPDYIGAEADAKIRASEPILLPREAMQPGNGRW